MRIASEYRDELFQVAIWLVEWGRNIFMLSRSNTLRQPRYGGSGRRTQIPWLATMHIGITLSGVCLSVCVCVCLSGSHNFLVDTHSYVLQATCEFLGMLPLCLNEKLYLKTWSSCILNWFISCTLVKKGGGHLAFYLSQKHGPYSCDPCDKTFPMVLCSDLDLWPTSLSKLLLLWEPQFSWFVCIHVFSKWKYNYFNS